MAAARYRVVHETVYDYSAPVISSHQLAHLRPRVTPWQAVLASHVDIDPAPGERAEGADYFGNHTLRVFIESPHERLAVRALSVVEVHPCAPDPAAPSPPWEQAAVTGEGRGEAGNEIEQYRIASPMIPRLAGCVRYAQESFGAGRPWLEAAFELTQRIRADFTYDPEATDLSTPVAEVLATRTGVCQDYANYMISCLRSLNLPARYVSGYILNRIAPGQERLTGADASHAWVAAHCPGHGWVAFDPTNGKLADTEFVTLGWGREFYDVTPLRGVVLGAATQKMQVAVTVDPLEGGPAVVSEVLDASA